MGNNLTANKIVLLFATVMLLLVGGRLIKSKGDASYFITAGTDFTNPAKTPTRVIAQPGQGYDGQFYYRMALAPSDFSKDSHGVNTDHPAYRLQRIVYPVAAWLLSFGGMPGLVPPALILVNILAFCGIAVYVTRFIKLTGGDIRMGLLPLALCGLYMSVGRDLSEVTEVFFFTGMAYYLFSGRYALMGVFAALTILSRETSLVSLAPIAAIVALLAMKRKISFAGVVWFILPFAAFGVWKLIIHQAIPTADGTVRTESIGMPVMGVIDSFKFNFAFGNTHDILQFLFWVAYLAWQAVFVITVLKKADLGRLLQPELVNTLRAAFVCWLVLALCFSENIYRDDWGFVRTFNHWNMAGILLLIATKKSIGKLFNYASAILAALTIARLILRV